MAIIEVMVVEGRQRRMDLVLYFSNPVRRGWVDVSVVNPQAPSYVGKDAVVCREKPSVRGGARRRARQGLSFAPLWSILLESLERGDECFGYDCRVSAAVVPVPDRDVTCSVERDLCSGLYGARSGGAGPCEQLHRGGGEFEGHQSTG